MTNQSPVKALVLFAHGSRDPNWRRPFESMLADLKARHAGLSTLAFLENMQPSLAEAIGDMARAGATHIEVIPLFLAVGGHLRKDLPLLLAEAGKHHEGVCIRVGEAAGENEAVQQALVSFALTQATRD